MGSFSTWLTLTFAGLAMGMIIFIVASGMTLVFGLMDVLNFGHGLFIAIGAYLAATVLGAMGDWTQSGSLWMNLAAVLPAMIVGMLVAGAVGLAFERVIVRPVYGQHLKQILITMGGMIIGEELIKMIWGPQTISLPLPEALRGAVLPGDAAIEKFRIVALVGGLAVLGGMLWLLNRTKLGLLIRAGVKTAKWSKAWATASVICSSACSWPARCWPDWAARCGACTSSPWCRSWARRSTC